MQSRVASLIEAPVFKPSIGEFSNFKSYIKKLEVIELKISFAKVSVFIIPPPEWSAKSKTIDDEYVIKTVLEQKCKKLLKGGYELSNEPMENMTFKDYKIKAVEEGHHLKTKSILEIEDTFWNTICKTRKTYSFENEFSLFGDDVVTWNLGRFTNAQSNIHAAPSQAERNRNLYEMPGIQKPYIYFGTPLSMFAFHIEDGNLNSINFLHDGEPKVW
ncbi:probable lysine-specific demethylase 4A [Sitodiplosis mosellana]|uniref:probable lysine-specific demethylase 4A n=1 Tax=Sitodiplosis mosellana TaxID=263140 RepID=UPI00244414DC|nr:probable lysine-specific demethylase 4A [Sitodiplosis mosellana]